MTGRLAIRHCIRDGSDVLSAPFLCQRMPLGRAGHARRHEFNEVFLRHCAARRNKDAQSHRGIE